MAKVYSYDRWDQVLQALGLEPNLLTIPTGNGGFGGGEGPEHKRLKEWVKHHPEILAVDLVDCTSTVEEPLPSGDSLDVSFLDSSHWVGVEVKPASSPDTDILRGMNQCVQ